MVEGENIKATDNITTSLVGNELTGSVENDPFANFSFDFEQVKPVTNDEINVKNNPTTFENVFGLKNAKNMLTKFIINPIKNNKPILVNGVLLYGQGDNGKTLLIQELANILDKKIISAKKLLSILENEEDRASTYDPNEKASDTTEITFIF